MVLSIHQSNKEILNLFDKVILMKEGYTVFFGTPTEMLSFYETKGLKCPTDFNPGDFVLDILFETPTSKLLEFYEKANKPSSSQNSSNEENLNKKDIMIKRETNPLLHQLLILLQRNLLYSLRHPETMTNMIVVPIFLSLLWGWLFYDVINSPHIRDFLAFVFMITTSSWGFLTPTMGGLYEMSEVYLKESKGTSLWKQSLSDCMYFSHAYQRFYLHDIGTNSSLLFGRNAWRSILYNVANLLFVYLSL